jgi:roadblock/LC7 domain-containing protein
MAILDDLLNVPGAVFAGESTTDGQLVNYKAKIDLPPELAATAAKFTSSMTVMFDALAAAYAELSRMPAVPQSGWMYSGGDWTVTVSGALWTVFKTEEAAFRTVAKPQAPSLITVDDILAIKGAVATGEYTADGKPGAYKATMDLSPELIATAARFIATISMMCGTLAEAFSSLSKMALTPQRGWMYSGGQLAVAANHACWTIAEIAEADLNELYSALISRS